ncbi:hypothetical protein N9M10_02025 [Hellea sp.]|nr:hypothetical protein [Hellea sp.]
MANILDISAGARSFIMGDYPDFSGRFSLERLMGITDILRNGTEEITDKSSLPEVLVLDRTRKILPDFFNTVNAMLICSDPFRKMVQDEDSGKHQFFPIKITFRNGCVFPNSNFFIVNVVARKKTVDVTKPSIHTYNDGVSYGMGYDEDEPVYFSKDALKGAHLWREAGFHDQLFMSDALLQRSKQQGMKVFKPRNPSKVIGG